mgnify:FL=1
MLLLLLLARSIFRRDWLAASAFVALTSVQALLVSESPWWIIAPTAVLLRLIPVVLAFRFGVLAVISCFVVVTLLCEMPIASDLTSWAALPGLAVFAVVAGLAAYAFHTATGGRGFAFGLND